MKKKTTMFALCLTGLALIGPLAAGQDRNFAGTWVGELSLNDGGSTKITLVLKKEGKGLAGTISDETGLLPAGTKLEDVALSGDEMKFTCKANDNTGTVTVKISMKIAGDRLTGRWEDEMNGTGGPVTLERKSSGS